VSDEYGIGRHVANLFVTQTYEGQSDIHGMSSASLCYCSADHATSSDSRESNHWNSGLLLSSYSTILSGFKDQMRNQATTSTLRYASGSHSRLALVHIVWMYYGQREGQYGAKG
jgi:hypothetical protein